MKFRRKKTIHDLQKQSTVFVRKQPEKQNKTKQNMETSGKGKISLILKDGRVFLVDGGGHHIAPHWRRGGNCIFKSSRASPFLCDLFCVIKSCHKAGRVSGRTRPLGFPFKHLRWLRLALTCISGRGPSESVAYISPGHSGECGCGNLNKALISGQVSAYLGWAMTESWTKGHRNPGYIETTALQHMPGPRPLARATEFRIVSRNLRVNGQQS